MTAAKTPRLTPAELETARAGPRPMGLPPGVIALQRATFAARVRTGLRITTSVAAGFTDVGVTSYAVDAKGRTRGLGDVHVLQPGMTLEDTVRFLDGLDLRAD